MNAIFKPAHFFNPFDEFKLISDTILNDFFRDIKPEDITRGFPVFDQYIDKDGGIVLDFALAGYKQSDLSISVEGDKLTITGNKQEGEDKGRRLARRAFTKTLIAGDDLNLEGIDATFENGLLQIKIPSKKVINPPSKTIQIKAK